MTARLRPDAVTVGAELPKWTLGPQSHTDIVRYQGASGDFNPVHHDPQFAEMAGVPGVFSVGMLQAGYLGTYCVDLFGPESVRRLAVRFAEQVWPGDELVCAGSVVAVDHTAEGGTAELELSISRAHGGVAVSGTATIVLATNGTERTTT